jgi:urease accessory protein
MFDQSPAPQDMQRARGEAAVALARDGLRGLRQAGSAKAFLPAVHGGLPEIVFLNTAGGIAGGDRFRYALALEAGAGAMATTQAAERAYRALGQETPEIEIALDLGPGASLAWLPQETILFEGARLSRRLAARLEGDARLLFCEMLVLGRTAMGERVSRLDLRDHREVLRDGAPVLIEPIRIADAAIARGGSPAIFGGARALATIALIAPGAEAMLPALRDVLPPGAAASGWNGKCLARILAPGGRALRRAAAAALSVLNNGTLPKVWRMGGEE